MNKERKEKLQKIIDYFMETGILIGSRRWGGYHDDSDYDLVFSKSEYERFIPRLNSYFPDITYEDIANYSQHDMFNIRNLKIYFKPEILKVSINILVYEDENIKKINQLNQWMDEISETKLGQMAKKDKSIRIKVVEMFLDYLFNDYKTIIEVIDPDDDFPF